MKTSQDQQSEQRERGRPVQAANLGVVDEATASPEIKRLYDQFREDFGRPQVPGILQCFATHPPLLSHIMGLAKSMLFVDGALDRRDKEMISTFVSATNRCSYCSDSHAYSFRVQGGPAPVLDAVLACDPESQALSAEDRTLLRFVRKINDESHSITLTDVETMRAAGWTDLQIAETIHVSALFAAFNRVVNAFGLPSQELLKQFERPEHESEKALHV